jgi:hypothetical protein
MDHFILTNTRVPRSKLIPNKFKNYITFLPYETQNVIVNLNTPLYVAPSKRNFDNEFYGRNTFNMYEEMFYNSFDTFVNVCNPEKFLGFLNNKPIPIQRNALMKVIMELLLIDPYYVKKCILYSGGSLFLYGTASSNDIDLLFIGISIEDINRVFSVIINIPDVDYVYFYQNTWTSKVKKGEKEYKTKAKNIILTKQFDAILNTRNYINTIVNIGGIYVFKFDNVVDFYLSRYDFINEGQRANVICDLISLRVNNNIINKLVVGYLPISSLPLEGIKKNYLTWYYKTIDIKEVVKLINDNIEEYRRR